MNAGVTAFILWWAVSSPLHNEIRIWLPFHKGNKPSMCEFFSQTSLKLHLVVSSAFCNFSDFFPVVFSLISMECALNLTYLTAAVSIQNSNSFFSSTSFK